MIVTPTSPRVKNRDPQPPIGVIASLVGGFELVNKQLLLAMFPLVLDVFFWVGPQLTLKPAIDAFARQLATMAAGAPTDSLLAQTAVNWQQLSANSDSLNLFWALSTAPLGLPSMMTWRVSETGAAHWLGVWGANSILLDLILFFFLTVAGFFLGALYFECIAQQTRDGRISVSDVLRHIWLDWLNLIGLGLAGLVVALVLGLPAISLAVLLAMLNEVLGSAALALAFSLVFWVLVFGVFSLHAITFGRRHLFAAIWESLRLVRANLAPTTGLVATVLLLYVGLGMVWTLAPTDSWLNLIGIAGHAVVSTALVSATFVYYQDRLRWWREQSNARAVRLRA